MVRMKNIMERNVLEYLSNLEGNPHDAVAFFVIGDVLYGNTTEDVSFGVVAIDHHRELTGFVGSLRRG